MTVRRVHNPVSGALEERLVFPAQDSSVRIMIRTEEINQILENFYLETVGDGAAKLAKRIQKVFVGLNKINIQKWLNTKPSVQKTKPLFINCAPLIPVQASKVMERNQIDLVDMRNVGGKDSRFHYILSVIDVFSRYIFLKPLETKSSKEVASVLMRIYDEFGPPRILQSDRGTEFKGAQNTAQEYHVPYPLRLKIFMKNSYYIGATVLIHVCLFTYLEYSLNYVACILSSSCSVKVCMS